MSETPTIATHASGPRAGQPVAPVPDDADRRREWAAALRDGSNRLLEPRGWASAADALRDRACVIESGVLTPWADQPEPSAPPAGPSAAAAAAGRHPDTPDRAEGAGLDLDAIEVTAARAMDHVVELCHGRKWTMRVPAQPGRDDDLVISAALEDVTALVAEVRRLVSPAAGRVLDAVGRWRVADPGGPEETVLCRVWDDLVDGTAVDALDGDQPAEPGVNSTANNIQPEAKPAPEPAIGCLLTEDRDMQAFAELPDCQVCEGTGKDLPPDWRTQPTEPAPEPDSLYEQLAAIEHTRWADWQRYMHSLCERRDDGALVIPADRVAHWERQINTPYAELSEAEKAMDREQVDRYWRMVRPAPEPAVVRLAEGVHWLGEVAAEDSHSLTDHARLPTGPAPEPARCDMRVERSGASWPCGRPLPCPEHPHVTPADVAPAPEPDSGPGWDREAIQELIRLAREDALSGDPASSREDLAQQLDALLADRDRLDGFLRFRLAELGARYEDLHAARAERDKALRLVALRDSEQAAHEGELGDLRAQMSAAEAETDAAKAELATARRDAAADALFAASRRLATGEGPGSPANIVAAMAAEIRAGTRPAPGSPQPASEGGSDDG